MIAEKVDQLTGILRRLNAGESPASVRAEAQAFLATVDAQELSEAEQKLVEAGLAVEDLRHLCSLHMEMLGPELDKLKAQLTSGHPLHTLTTEHECILRFLDALERVNGAIQRLDRHDPERPEFAELRDIADHLVGAEPHHQREEQVLFPEVEGRGLTGPPHIMRLEHEDLRRRKHEIQELAERVGEMDFDEFKRRLDVAAKVIVATLRDHIFKEDHILYPAALQAIPEETVWARMKAACDAIGYCCFTPAA